MPKVGDLAPDFKMQYVDKGWPEGSKPEPIPWEEAGCPGVLRVCLHRWLNGANEKLPAKSEKAGSYRHPGPGCEHG